VTKAIADRWTYRLTTQEAHDMPDAFRIRIIQLFIGDRDRGSNGLRRMIHEVAQHLSHYMDTRTKEQWLQVLVDGLDRCELCNSRNNTIVDCKHRGYMGQWELRRLEAWCRHTDAEEGRTHICTTAFMFAVLAEDEELQCKLINDGISMLDDCSFLGSLLGMACRLGLQATVSRLLAAGAKDDDHRDDNNGYGQQALFCAIRSNQADIVRLLLEANSYERNEGDTLRYAASMARENNNREILEHILAVSPEQGAYGAIKAAALNGWEDMLERLLVPETFSPEEYWPEDAIGVPIVHAAEGGRWSIFQLVHSRDPPGRYWWNTYNLLQAAAFGGNVQVLEFVRRENLGDDVSYRLPVVAAVKGHLDMLQYLLDNSFHLKRRKARKGREMMRYALLAGIYNQHCGIVNLLVRRLKMDLNTEHLQEGEDLIVPLIASVDSGSSDMVRLLISLGGWPERIDWSSFGFSIGDRRERHAILGKYNTLRLKLSRRYSTWEYSVRQKHVDEALGVIREYETGS